MSRRWTRISGPDASTGEFRVRIAPTFHGGSGLLLATPCADRAEAESFSRRVDCFLDHLADGLAEYDADEVRVSDLRSWFTPYYDLRFYLRLIPECMDPEEAGYSHGISIDGMFASKAEADDAAVAMADELSALLGSLASTLEDGDPLARALSDLVPQASKTVM